jgi:uncharacterized membrane protein
VLLEGLEVAFIVITFGLQANDSLHTSTARGAQPNGILLATLGAAATCALVVGVGALVRRCWRASPRTRSSSSSA